MTCFKNFIYKLSIRRSGEGQQTDYLIWVPFLNSVYIREDRGTLSCSGTSQDTSMLLGIMTKNRLLFVRVVHRFTSGDPLIKSHAQEIATLN